MAWREFRRGKRNKKDIQEFEFNLEDDLFELHQDLKNKIYTHSNYTAFNVCDPKLRRIHKASVRDRVLHHAIFRILYPIFDKSFIFDSYSCRLNKGTHRAVNRLEMFARKLSKNSGKNIFALKCDIKKFFDSIDQNVLLELIRVKIQDEGTLWLIEIIIKSFEKSTGKGVPLGNVTSQLFANIYLNELDQFIKHKLKVRYYLRYCDDFIILGEDKEYLNKTVDFADKFLNEKLKLTLHPNKIIIRKFHQGIDFLGYVVLFCHRQIRTKTRKRILKKLKMRAGEYKEKKISKETATQSLQSYLGVLSHANESKLSEELKNQFWFWMTQYYNSD